MDIKRSIIIFKTENEIDIHRAAEYLKENGINCVSQNINTQNLIGIGKIGSGINPAIGSYQLLVLEEDSERASELLRQIFISENFKEKEVEQSEEYKQINNIEEDWKDNTHEDIKGVIYLINIIGYILIFITIIAFISSFFLSIPHIHTYVIIIAILSLISNGFVGYNKKKTFPIIFGLISGIIIFLVFFKISYEKIELQNSLARIEKNFTYYSFKDAKLELNKALMIAERNNIIEEKFFILSKLADIYEENSNYKESLKIENMILEFSEQNNDIENILIVLYRIAVVYESNNEILNAIEYHNKAIALAEKVGDKRSLFSNFMKLGTLYKKLDKYETAVNNELIALKLAKEINDNKLILYITNNIGISYQKLENYNLAIKYYEDCIEILKKIKDEKLVAALVDRIERLNKLIEQNNE